MLADYRRALEVAIAEGGAPVHEAHGRALGSAGSAKQAKQEATTKASQLTEKLTSLSDALATADADGKKAIDKAHKSISDEVDAVLAQADQAQEQAELYALEAVEVEQEAHLAAFEACKAKWVPLWARWTETCEENIAGSCDDLPAKIAAVETELEAQAHIKRLATGAQIRKEQADYEARREATGNP
jgi:type I site-specific restriction endonuclease